MLVKKKLSFFVLACCSLLFLTGVECKLFKAQPTPAPKVSPTPNFLGTESSKVNVTMWYPFGNPDAEQFYQSIAKKYSLRDTHKYVTVTTINKGSYLSYSADLKVKLNSSEGPDIYLVRNGELNKYLREQLAPIPQSIIEYQSAEGEDLYKTAGELIGKFLPAAKQELLVSKTNEKGEVSEALYGLPLFYQGLALVINNKLFQDYNLAHPNAPVSIPSTTKPLSWTEFGDLAIKLNKTQDGWIKFTQKPTGEIELDSAFDSSKLVSFGTALGAVSNILYSPDVASLLLQQRGIQLTDPTTSKSSFDSTKNIDETTKQLLAFVGFSKLWNLNAESSISEFKEGRVAMAFIRSFNVAELRSKPGLDFTIIPVPQTQKEQTSEWVTDNYYWTLVVPKSSKNPAVAWDFIKYLTSKDNAKQLAITLRQPIVRPDIVKDVAQDTEYLAAFDIFNQQIAYTRGIYKGEVAEFDTEFKGMLDDIWKVRDNSNAKAEARKIIEARGQEISKLLQNRPWQ